MIRRFSSIFMQSSGIKMAGPTEPCRSMCILGSSSQNRFIRQKPTRCAICQRVSICSGALSRIFFLCRHLQNRCYCLCKFVSISAAFNPGAFLPLRNIRAPICCSHFAFGLTHTGSSFANACFYQLEVVEWQQLNTKFSI